MRDPNLGPEAYKRVLDRLYVRAKDSWAQASADLVLAGNQHPDRLRKAIIAYEREEEMTAIDMARDALTRR